MSHTTEITGLRGRERLLSALRAGRYPALCGCYAGVGLVLGLGRIIGGQAPFGAALLTAVPLRFTLPVTLGVTAGYLFGGGMKEGYALIGCTLVLTLLRWLVGERWEKRKSWMAPAISALAVFATGVYPLLYGSPLVYDVVMWVTQVVMAGASAAFLERVATAAEKGESFRDRLNSTALAVLGALLLMGLDAVSLGGVTLGRVAAATAVLVAARIGGPSIASITGLVCGLVIGFSTGNFTLYITAYGLGGLLAGIFSAFGRPGSTAAFTITYGLIGFMVAGSPAGFFEVALAAILFLMIPMQWFRLGSAVLGPAAADEEAVKLVVEERICAAAGALRDVSQTTRDVARRLVDLSGGPAGADLSGAYDRAAEKVCGHCPYRMSCWQDNYSDTLDGLGHGLGLLRRGQPLGASDFPGSLERCVKKDQMAAFLTDEYRIWVGREDLRRRTARLRSVVTDQFDGLSLALESVMDNVEQVGAGDRVLAARVKELFLDARLEPQSAVCWKDRQGRTTIKVTVPRYKMTRAIPGELLEELRTLTDLNFAYPVLTDGRQQAHYTFHECPSFGVEYGVCQISCRDNKLCGDSYRFLTVDGASANLILSDGMGSGGGAAVDSTMAAALLARMLEAGMSYESALRLVNSALSVKSGEESLATVDGAQLDLYTGRVRLFKAGAAPTVVLRDGHGLEIDSNSLPAGILSGVEFETSELSLSVGDLVILLSDGATTQGSNWIARMAEKENPKDLDEFCKKIAATARLRRTDGREDDITVLCCRLVPGPGRAAPVADSPEVS